MRAASPRNQLVNIPPSLAEVAAQSNITLNIPSLASDFATLHQTVPPFEERGEMGGKRRKLPHERAGWKEMDQEPKLKRRRGGRRPGIGQATIDLMHQHPQGEIQDDGPSFVHHNPEANVVGGAGGLGAGASLGQMAAAGEAEGKPNEGNVQHDSLSQLPSQNPQEEQPPFDESVSDSSM